VTDPVADPIGNAGCLAFDEAILSVSPPTNDHIHFGVDLEHGRDVGRIIFKYEKQYQHDFFGCSSL